MKNGVNYIKFHTESDEYFTRFSPSEAPIYSNFWKDIHFLGPLNDKNLKRFLII